MALNLQNNYKKILARTSVTALVAYIFYKLFTGYFGPVPLRVNVSNADLENIVVKLTIKGMKAPLKGGHELSRYTLHEDVKFLKANELTEFPREYMWMAMEPVEYMIEIYHPALYSTHKVVKLTDLESSKNILITEINASFIREMTSSAKKKYDDATEQKQKDILKTQALDAMKRTLIHTRDRYVPIMKNLKQKPDETYRQVKQLLVDCEHIFTTFDYGKKCYLDDAFLKRYVGLEQ